MLPLVDQVRDADVDAVIVPSPTHLDTIQLHALMCIVDVETACPRMSFAQGTILPCQMGRYEPRGALIGDRGAACGHRGSGVPAAPR